MGFNADKFERAAFEPRKAKVAVPALAAFFDEGEAPEFEVRGLSASELHKAMEAGRRQGSVDAIVKAIAQNGDQAGAIRKALGLTADTPGEIAKRLEAVRQGADYLVIGRPITQSPDPAGTLKTIASSLEGEKAIS